jgi:hypothetical protein
MENPLKLLLERLENWNCNTKKLNALPENSDDILLSGLETSKL